METILFVASGALICMCLLGYIVGSVFSQAFEGESKTGPTKEAEQHRARKTGVIYPVRRRVPLQRAA